MKSSTPTAPREEHITTLALDYRRWARSRPLLGLTIALIEDSRYCSDAVRLMALRSGARLRRADCIASARRHLSMYRPHVVIVDLGLPDGCGLEIIRDLSNSRDFKPPVIGISGGHRHAAEYAARHAGASDFMAKPFGLEQFQSTILAALPDTGAPRRLSLRLVTQHGSEIIPDRQAYFEDLKYIQALLQEAWPRFETATILYALNFIQSLARLGCNDDLREAAYEAQNSYEHSNSDVAHRSYENLISQLSKALCRESISRDPLTLAI